MFVFADDLWRRCLEGEEHDAKPQFFWLYTLKTFINVTYLEKTTIGQ